MGSLVQLMGSIRRCFSRGIFSTGVRKPEGSVALATRLVETDVLSTNAMRIGRL